MLSRNTCAMAKTEPNAPSTQVRFHNSNSPAASSTSPVAIE
ncbi:Uncharacterised protein [Mycobacteroides abscessus subsp. abscessus]|nr:Uncharacterised protein [Mycobacteroides abscessus subsp. abscessus]